LIRLGFAPELTHATVWGAKRPLRMSHTPGVRMALSLAVSA